MSNTAPLPRMSIDARAGGSSDEERSKGSRRSKSAGLCIKNHEFCIGNDEFSIKNHEFCTGSPHGSHSDASTVVSGQTASDYDAISGGSTNRSKGSDHSHTGMRMDVIDNICIYMPAIDRSPSLIAGTDTGTGTGGYSVQSRRAMYTENDGFYTQNDGLCTNIDGFCTKDDGFCTKTDDRDGKWLQ